MTIPIQVFSDTLRTTVQNTDFSAVDREAEEAIAKFNASAKTILGRKIGEVKGGIEALSQEIDDEETAQNPNQVPAVGRVTSNVPNVGPDLVGDVGTAASNIELITGTPAAAQNGNLREIITAVNPQAVQKSLEAATGKSIAELTPALQKLTSGSLQSLVSNAVKEASFLKFMLSGGNFIDAIKKKIQSNSLIFLSDFAEKLSKKYEIKVGSLIDKAMGASDIRKTFAQIASGNYDTAFSTIKKHINVPDNYDLYTSKFPKSDWPSEVTEANTKIAAAESEFKTLSVDVSSYTTPYSVGSAAAGTNSRPVYSVGSGVGKGDPAYIASADEVGPNGEAITLVPDSSGFSGKRVGISKGGDTWHFDDITSYDELESMFRNMQRKPGQEISGAIIHWSASFLNQNVGSSSIHEYHKNGRKFSGIGYHIVIRRDGTMQRGRPLNRTGAHDINNNTNFLGFCFIGGLNIHSSKASKPYWKYSSVESLTSAQFNTYDGLMETFHRVLPYAQVNGHYHTSNDGKVDPGFDVPGYSQSKFGHVNVIKESDPRWNSRTRIDIAAIRAAGANV